MAGVAAVARVKIDYLQRIPLLAARLREPGVRDECIKQYEDIRIGNSWVPKGGINKSGIAGAFQHIFNLGIVY